MCLFYSGRGGDVDCGNPSRRHQVSLANCPGGDLQGSRGRLEVSHSAHNLDLRGRCLDYAPIPGLWPYDCGHARKECNPPLPLLSLEMGIAELKSNGLIEAAIHMQVRRASRS